VRKSQECQKVDTFYAEDGSKYGISHLDDGAIQYLVRGLFTHLSLLAKFTSLTKVRTERSKPLLRNLNSLQSSARRQAEDAAGGAKERCRLSRTLDCKAGAVTWSVLIFL
jgi:hypothetical protein